ncbi:hypothetical protein [Lewinella sp. IMCC34183]|uniref:hypothetical protein n=1 Tax=Lewinella sp. IMCC34183 TaxID=2248762 RepID=UPI000E28696D|nr:hypothetical protein [Lewinella sp. IMCC34183]
MNTLRYSLFIFFILGSLAAAAQEYSSAAGLRLGYPLSLSYKTFVSETAAIEAYAGFRGYSGASWISINAAYQIHADISDVEGLQYYYGGGVGAQFWTFDFVESSNTTFSLAGYVGLQYTFPDTPISVSLDWVPTYFIGSSNYYSYSSFGGGYGGLGVRYVLGRN